MIINWNLLDEFAACRQTFRLYSNEGVLGYVYTHDGVYYNYFFTHEGLSKYISGIYASERLFVFLNKKEVESFVLEVKDSTFILFGTDAVDSYLETGNLNGYPFLLKQYIKGKFTIKEVIEDCTGWETYLDLSPFDYFRLKAKTFNT